MTDLIWKMDRNIDLHQ